MKSFKTSQEQLTLPQGTQIKTFKKKIFYPIFKPLYPYDVQLANKRNIHFRRIKNQDDQGQSREKPNQKEDFESEAYQRLIKRNIRFLRGTKIANFKSRPSSFLVNKILYQELYQKDPFLNLQKTYKTKDFQKEFRKEFISSFLLFIRNKISVRHLMLYSFIIHNQSYKRKYFRHLNTVTSLTRVHNSFLEMDGHLQIAKHRPDIELKKISKSLTIFQNLRKISLDTTKTSWDLSLKNTEITSSQAFLCEVFKVLSQAPTLNTIEIKMNIVDIDKKAQKMKEFTDKLSQLKSLKLDFHFPITLKETGRIYTTLLPLTTLRHLSLTLTNRISSLNCSDVSDFISSLKNLETLQFTCRVLLFDQYVLLFQAIQKLKSLNKLSVIQTFQTPESFAYGIVFKTLTTLKKLTSVKIDVGHIIDSNDLNAYVQHLLKHPALKEVSISWRIYVRYTSMYTYTFDDEFYANLQKLRHKFSKFKLTLRVFPDDVQKEIENIVIRNRYDLKNFNCTVSIWDFCNS